MFKQTLIKDLKSTVNFCDGSDDIELVQVGVAEVDVELRDGVIVRVTAPQGIVFARGGLRVSREDYCDVTDLCDRAAIKKQLASEQEERDEMRIHTSGAREMIIL